MVDIDSIDTQIENVDQLPVIYGLLQKMNVQATIDNAIQPHGNWQGLSIGWVITVWYLTPLAYLKDEPELLPNLLADCSNREDEMSLIFLEADLPANSQMPDESLAIARGFEVDRERTFVIDGKELTWRERLLVVRSFSYMESMISGLYRRLDSITHTAAPQSDPAERPVGLGKCRK